MKKQKVVNTSIFEVLLTPFYHGLGTQNVVNRSEALNLMWQIYTSSANAIPYASLTDFVCVCNTRTQLEKKIKELKSYNDPSYNQRIDSLEEIHYRVDYLYKLYTEFMTDKFIPLLKNNLKSLKERRAKIQEGICKYYSKKWSQLTDGVSIIDEEFAIDYNLYLADRIPKDQELFKLCDAFSDYLDTADSLMVMQNIIDLYLAYEQEQVGNGEISFQYREPIQFVNNQRILGLCKKATANLNEQRRKYYRVQKKLETMENQGATHDPRYQELLQELEVCNDRAARAADLEAMLGDLQTRCEAELSIIKCLIKNHPLEMLSLDENLTTTVMATKHEIRTLIDKAQDSPLEDLIEKELRVPGKMWNLYQADEIFQTKKDN